MQIIHIELTNLEAGATDRLIQSLKDYLSSETNEIHLEVSDRNRKVVPLPAGGHKILYVPRSSIRHVTSDRHFCCFCLLHQTLRLRIRYTEAKSLLPEDEFLECNRGVLLGMSHIREVSGDCFLMDDGAVFPVRHSDRKEILLKFRQFQQDHEA